MPHFVTDGHRIEYQLTAPLVPGAPTVVFLHEGLGTLSAWRDFPDQLAGLTGCGTLMYSRWGYGGSDRRPGRWPITYLHDEGATVLPELLRACGLGDVVLFGHSDGGSIALIAGAIHPALAKGIITEAAHVVIEHHTHAGLRQAKARFETGDLREKLRRVHQDNTDDLFGSWSGVWLEPGSRDWTICPLLPSVRCPVLALQGVADEYGTPAQLEKIAALGGGRVETWLIDACGHTPHREHPDAVLTRAAAFIGGL